MGYGCIRLMALIYSVTVVLNFYVKTGKGNCFFVQPSRFFGVIVFLGGLIGFKFDTKKSFGIFLLCQKYESTTKM